MSQMRLSNDLAHHSLVIHDVVTERDWPPQTQAVAQFLNCRNGEILVSNAQTLFSSTHREDTA